MYPVITGYGEDKFAEEFPEKPRALPNIAATCFIAHSYTQKCPKVCTAGKIDHHLKHRLKMRVKLVLKGRKPRAVHAIAL